MLIPAGVVDVCYHKYFSFSLNPFFILSLPEREIDEQGKSPRDSLGMDAERVGTRYGYQSEI
jgi:hypothetical protein